VRRKEQDWAF